MNYVNTASIVTNGKSVFNNKNNKDNKENIRRDLDVSEVIVNNIEGAISPISVPSGKSLKC
jgi:hypothetical protein